MNEEESKQLLKAGNRIVEKAIEIERLDLLYDMTNYLAIIADAVKPYDFFDARNISVKKAHDKVEWEFATKVYEIVVMPVPVDFTVFIDSLGSPENKHELQEGESVSIERKCQRMYYSNAAAPSEEEKVRIHVSGRW